MWKRELRTLQSKQEQEKRRNNRIFPLMTSGESPLINVDVGVSTWQSTTVHLIIFVKKRCFVVIAVVCFAMLFFHFLLVGRTVQYMFIPSMATNAVEPAKKQWYIIILVLSAIFKWSPLSQPLASHPTWDNYGLKIFFFMWDGSIISDSN